MLPVFVLEPSLLRTVREGHRRRAELWNNEHHRSVTFGVIDPGLDLSRATQDHHLLVSAMSHENYEFWEKNDPDPRGMSIFRRTYREYPPHYVLWVPVQGYIPMLPTGGLLQKEESTCDLISEVFTWMESEFSFQNDTFKFLKEIETSERDATILEPITFTTEYHLDKSKQAETFLRERLDSYCFLNKQILDSVGVPFWLLSSGTCLADEYIWNGGTQASTGNKFKYIFPPLQLCWTKFLDLWVRVKPCPASPYIYANYGPKWMTPDKKLGLEAKSQ
ncbi:hypothetical protein Btru_007649 [Bulinus truncatus]|nr:hypothetical protein Btru_007649 [Bulinus truncatus]